MGSVRKASAWLGLVDDNDDERYYDDDYSEGTESGDAWVTDPRVKVAADVAEEKGRRIGTVTPDSFRDARAIGEMFRDGVPVIMNLTAMEAGDAKRVVDFAAGLIFGLRGSIERVSTRVFLLTPADTEIVSGEPAAHRADGFFNQS
ncbi:cell division protein SepF 1 [Streptomyces sp. NBRC 14336]|uniref:cell division protein SepF n=1 Tax=Streptomyces sp. NBRC 14336 TaxID=3030992 RepID=UPI0024A022CA|nr:cell division protein SepF [Streptomyces sp. NBRC 14336]WBO77060.1 cell division protein SepF [Streptomyces sp. SBE_14.2]GLW46238.1 cell division protein SepF 1 [Streptomyces sp. NBRC 14336]